MASSNEGQAGYVPPQDPGYFGQDAQIQSWLDNNLSGYLEANPGAIQWKTLLGSSSIFLPSGIILDFGGDTAPDGFVLGDGSTYDGTNPLYLNLWAIYGVKYGGSGQSAFKVPDLRGRVAVGFAKTGGHADVSTLGNVESGGVAVANRRPVHNHTSAANTGSASAGTPSGTVSITGSGAVAGTVGAGSVGTSPSNTSSLSATFSGNSLGSHSHSMGLVGPAGTNPSDSQAYIVLNRIIKL